GRRRGAAGGGAPRARDGVAAGPMEPRRELRLAAELADPHAELGECFLRGVASVLGIGEQVPGEPLHLGGVALTERLERPLVTVLRSLDQDRIAQLLVDERPLRPRCLRNLTALAQGGLHGGRSLVV